MAVGAAGVKPARPVTVGTFARLKLRVLANSMRGQAWRVTLFVLGALGGLFVAGVGFFTFLISGIGERSEAAVLLPVFGGGGLVLAWVLGPLIWTGVDETLDPTRFALLPLPRRTLIAGLLTGALLGIPAVATLIATSGLVAGAGMRGGVAAAVAQAVGVLLGLLLCVTASRAMTSAFASLLRARRTRDLAAVVLALLAAMIGPLQIGIGTAVQEASFEDLARIAEPLGWTPLAAPYLIGFDVAAGRPGAAVARLVIALGAIALLLWWWSRTVESAMVGAAAAGTARDRRGSPGGPVAQLYPRLLGWLPRNQYGALVARDLRYWWRDPRRRAGLITMAVVGVVVPLMVNFVGLQAATGSDITLSPGIVAASMLFVGSLAAVSIANQFGYDGSAYSMHLVVGVPGRVEMRARAVAFSLIMVPLLLVIATVFAVVLADPGVLAALLGALFAAYGTGLAANQLISIFGAYAMPETSNPFAISTGAGIAKSMLAFVALFAGLALAAPLTVAAVLLPPAWSWILLPLGAGYGLAAASLGSYIAGDVLDRRAPELLATVTPNR
ncbi:MAG: ABC transporter permease [Micromonosporaceae bacterium]